MGDTKSIYLLEYNGADWILHYHTRAEVSIMKSIRRHLKGNRVPFYISNSPYLDSKTLIDVMTMEE